MALIDPKNVFHVEVCLKQKDSRRKLNYEQFQHTLQKFLKNTTKLPLNRAIKIDPALHQELENVYSIMVDCETTNPDLFIPGYELHNMVFHFYSTYERAMEPETFENASDGNCEQVPASSHWLLPNNAFAGMWESLIYDDGTKAKLLKYALTALTFSKYDIDQNIISCNRLILLYGPPGTGKTSLCKSLAQKLAIRANDFYRTTHLIEINSHSLFSKWFSESGKLVMRLFENIREITADKHNLVCVLIDEVESLAYARNNMSGQEPKDAMRVVNALLTQLDSIKEYSNVLILATSNIVDSIDVAFLDRADIKLYIGTPAKNAVKKIYASMFLELMRVGIIEKESLESEDKHEGLLTELAEKSLGLSGRTLRKLPFIAHAERTFNIHSTSDHQISLSDFMDDMLAAVEMHQKEKNLNKHL